MERPGLVFGENGFYPWLRIGSQLGPGVTMRTAVLLAITAAMVHAASAQVGETPGAPDPCGLFTPAEIAGFLGEPVEGGDRDTLTTACSWYAKDDDSDSFAMLVIWPKKAADTPYLTKTMEPHPELGEGGYA